MCGICGIVYHDASRPVSVGLVTRMADAVKHRGPDDGGVYAKENVGLGFRRLAIIDLSPAGHQPMSNEDGTIWAVFNGEIYNFPELREQLFHKGHTFRSHTDTETIIHLWEEEGEDCVCKLRGMFAFAIWDERRKSLFLARDREGKKPVFYAALPDRFLFGSEIKSILQDPDFVAEPDLEGIHHYLAFQAVPAPYSAFKGVKKLPPAHTLLLRDGRTKLRRYWKLSYKNKRQVHNEKDIADLQYEIIERLREAVRIRLMSDVPLGALLSGGIDSSLILALMADLTNQPVKTFSIGFDSEEYTELPYARMVAERYATDHHEFIVTPDAQSIFPDLVWHYNEPFADSSAIPTYYVSKMARQFVTVVLTGDGGDECFAGYPRYCFKEEHPLGISFPSLVSRILRPTAMLAAFMRGDNWAAKMKRLRELNEKKLSYYYRITHFHEIYQSELYTEEFARVLRRTFTVDWMLGKFRNSDAQNFLDATLDVDLSFYLPDVLMAKVDIASMTHSLEARAPFLDHEFLEFAATIPSNLKLRDGTASKYILKKAAESYLPHEVIYRRKMGFGVPIEHWFRNELKDLARDCLLGAKAVARGYFRRDYVERILNRHLAGEPYHYLIWNLLMLELWHQMFIDRTMSVPRQEPSLPSRVVLNDGINH
jgi:asparagine synthase (glutamine-hydrolysing)